MHATSRNKKKVKDLLKKNYNFSNAIKVYQLFKNKHIDENNRHKIFWSRECFIFR